MAGDKNYKTGLFKSLTIIKNPPDMFKPETVKALSIVAMILSLIGLGISIAAIVMVSQFTFAFALGALSWVILLWASYIGFKLSGYKLYEEEYKKVGIRVILIIVAFVLFFYVGLVLGLVLSVVLLSTLWALKRNYDEWDNSDTTHPTDSSHTIADSTKTD